MSKRGGRGCFLSFSSACAAQDGYAPFHSARVEVRPPPARARRSLAREPGGASLPSPFPRREHDGVSRASPAELRFRGVSTTGVRSGELDGIPRASPAD